jgi:hypothetical protein
LPSGGAVVSTALTTMAPIVSTAPLVSMASFANTDGGPPLVGSNNGVIPQVPAP